MCLTVHASITKWSAQRSSEKNKEYEMKRSLVCLVTAKENLEDVFMLLMHTSSKTTKVGKVILSLAYLVTFKKKRW